MGAVGCSWIEYFNMYIVAKVVFAKLTESNRTFCSVWFHSFLMESKCNTFFNEFWGVQFLKFT